MAILVTIICGQKAFEWLKLMRTHASQGYMVVLNQSCFNVNTSIKLVFWEGTGEGNKHENSISEGFKYHSFRPARGKAVVRLMYVCMFRLMGV